MSHQKITHEIAIPRSLTIILATLALGVIANALAPVFHIEQAGAPPTAARCVCARVRVRVCACACVDG